MNLKLPQRTSVPRHHVPISLNYHKMAYADRCATQIKGWLNTCSNTHSQDCNGLGSSILPKRLIFFNDNPSTEHLVTVDELKERPQYVALSYCWGREQNFKTEAHNLREMEQCIPYDQLPKTLRDVFLMVRKLGFRYLWIDALCILQDPTGDEWRTEAGKMGDAYANASLVISATASPSVHYGLFADMREDYTDEQKTEFHRIMRTCRTMTQSEWHGPIKDTHPLLCRAWAFQERLLARRTVHFTNMELIWECMGDRWCECSDESLTGGLTGKINNLNCALRECRVDPDPAKARLMWRECVKSFSKRDLTMLNDRLFAIAGIASYIRGADPTAYHNQYHYGLWKDFLPWDLLWYCDQTSSLREAKSRGPSYSWSSVDCGVEWPTCDHLGSDVKFSQAISTGTCIEFKPEDHASEQEGRLCKVAAVETCGVTITSRIARVLISGSHIQPMQGQSWTVKSAKGENEQTLPFYPDIVLSGSNDRQEIETYYYIEIAGIKVHSSVREMGLIVRKYRLHGSDCDMPVYERVGIAGDISCSAKGSKQSWFTGGEVQKIILV